MFLYGVWLCTFGTGLVKIVESRGSSVLEGWPYVFQALSKTILFSETAVSATPSFLDLSFLLIFYILQLRSLGRHQSIFTNGMFLLVPWYIYFFKSSIFMN